MKLFLSFCLLSFSFLNSNYTYSQNGNDKQVVISGESYILHTINKSETTFSICQKYQVSQSELAKANPDLSTILQAGTTIKIPKAKQVISELPIGKKEKKPAPTEEYYYHKVSKNQTLFSIAKQYGVSDADLIRSNPELAKGLVVGQVLKIPVKITKTKEQSISENSEGSGNQSEQSGFITHMVVSGETLYSLERRYELSHEEMISLNPVLEDGLKTGMKLKIPNRRNAPVEEVPTKNQSYTKYKVESGETLYSLAARFGVDVSDIKKANPSLLSRSLESGETILIPQKTIVSNEKITGSIGQSSSLEKNDKSGNTNCKPLSGNNKQKYKAGILLPLYLPGNDQSSSINANKSLIMSKMSLLNSNALVSQDTALAMNGVNIDQKAIGFLEFYEGTLLAIDSLQQLGMNIELYVFDASNQQMINTLLQLEEFRNLDIIIGPVLPELQQSVAAFAAKNRIPMVSPLSTSGNLELTNSYYFKVNPDKDYQIEQSAQYIERKFSDKNFILLQIAGNSNSQEAKLAQIVKERLGSNSRGHLFHEYNFQTQGINSIKSILKENDENIFMIPTDNEAKVSIAVTNLNALAENYNIVLMGTPTLTKLKSLQTESFHRIRLRYLTPYFVDYNKPLVRRFVSQYRETFSTEPTQFSFQGFDVSFYFLSALYRFGADFRNCVPNYPMELTQMDFNFRKVAQMGGFMNHSLFVNSYERNFDILNFDVVVGE